MTKTQATAQARREIGRAYKTATQSEFNAVTLNVTYRTDCPSGAVSAYTLSIEPTALDGAGYYGLKSHGPVAYNVSSLRGVYASRADAITAALSYLPSCTIVERVHVLTGDVTQAVHPFGYRLRAVDGVRATLLGSKTPRGTFVSASA